MPESTSQQAHDNHEDQQKSSGNSSLSQNPVSPKFSFYSKYAATTQQKDYPKSQLESDQKKLKHLKNSNACESVTAALPSSELQLGTSFQSNKVDQSAIVSAQTYQPQVVEKSVIF